MGVIFRAVLAEQFPIVYDPNPLITRYESLRAKLNALDKRGESFSEEAQQIDRELAEIERQLPGGYEHKRLRS